MNITKIYFDNVNYNLNIILMTLKPRETNTKASVNTNSVRDMFMTFKLCNELEILLPNTTSHFSFQFASAIYSQKLHADI